MNEWSWLVNHVQGDITFCSQDRKRGSKVFLGTTTVCKKQASVLKVLVNCERWHCPQNAFTLWMNISGVIMSDQPRVVGFAGELIFHRELGTKWCDRAMGGGGGGVPVSLGWNRSELLDEHIGGWTLTDTCCCAKSCCLLSHISVKCPLTWMTIAPIRNRSELLYRSIVLLLLDWLSWTSQDFSL